MNDNAGLSVTPSSDSFAGSDDYEDIPAFMT
jgi:hypothetical protein